MKRIGTVKRALWIGICLVIVLSLVAGCSKSGSKEEAGGNKQTSQGVTEISFVAYSNYEEPLKEVIEEFQKQNENIRVKLQLSPFNQLMETIEIKLGSKSEDIDLLFVDSPLTTNYTLKGYLEPLDSLIGNEVKDKWVESAVESASYQGQLMSAPMNSSSIVLYYNNEIFRERGITPPDADQRLTWEEIVELAQQLTYDTNGDGQNDVFGFSFDQIGRAFQLLALSDSAEVSLISEDGLSTNGLANSDEAVQVFQLYADLFNKYKVSPKIKREEAIDYFVSGKIAMFLGPNHNLPKLKESKMDFGVSKHPYFAGKKVATPTGAWNVGISKFSKNKEAAAEFLKFLTYGDGAKIMFEVGGTLPVHKDLLSEIESDPKYSELPDLVTRIAAIESRETAVPRPKTPGYLEWEKNMNDVFEDIKNGTDVKKALDSAADVIDNLLKKYAEALK